MSAATLAVRSPVDGRLLRELPVQGDGEVRGAVDRARAAQKSWAALPVSERARRMRRLARVLGERGEDIATSIRAETGKPPSDALAEVVVSVDLIRYYARVAAKYLAPRRTGTGWLLSKSGWVEREPFGVVGAITPWNYPFIIAMDCVTPALFAGNGVVVKPSEFTPVTTLLIPELCAQAGIPAQLVQVVTGDGGTGRALIGAGVDRVVFTGSTGTGRKVMEAASQTLTPVTLELGGKDAAVVLEDADLERAARGIVFGGFFNAGQTCISVERVFVVRSVYEPFLARVVAATKELRVGNDAAAEVGPMITEQQIALVEGQVRNAVSRGARALTGGVRPPGEGRVFPPTVLVDVDDSMDVMRDETFGPILPITPVDDEDDAVQRANASGYGLFASVWTGSRRRGLAVARRLRAGGVSINDVLSHYSVPHLPVGGVGDSGFGRRRGLEGLDEMTRTRTLLADRFGLRREPWWFPYSPTSVRMMQSVLDWRSRGGVGGLWRAARRLLGRNV
ncbi:MAG TPA: aldehyde dehydrogenase family protein [Longimicrobiales bacterium]|nr:aldehyde dehydrogenase family protein [Longimicrobiales bacterium]